MKAGALVLLMLAACATPYQHQGFRGGYTETRLSGTEYAIHFKGNAYTSMERAHDFALLRAAEISLRMGCPTFKVGYQDVDQRTGSPFAYNSSVMARPKATVTVAVCMPGYDAEYVSASIRDKWEVKP